MTTDKALDLDLALASLEKWKCVYPEEWDAFDEAAITAIKQARSAPVQSAERGEPVGVVGWAANRPNTVPVVHWADECPEIGTKIYTAAPVRDKCFLCGERVESCASTVCPKATSPAAQPDMAWIERERAVGYREGHMAALAQRQWVGLTDEEIDKHLNEDAQGDCEMHEYARAIEAKLKEKNT
jgi:hypothetical protein